MNEYDFAPILMRLKNAKKEAGLTNEELSVASGIPVGTLNKILSGDTTEPKLPALMSIASAPNTSVDFLIYGRAPSVGALSKEETDLISSFRSFNPEGRSKILSYVSDLSLAGIYKNNHRMAERLQEGA